MDDFCKCFDSLDICSLSLGFLDASTDYHWTYKFHEGRWVTGTTAGGCANYQGNNNILLLLLRALI